MKCFLKEDLMTSQKNLRFAALVSGGKDSTLAIHRIITRGFTVKKLVAMIPQREDSWMFHYPNIHLTKLFSEATGIPIVQAETSGVKEEELNDLKKVLSKLDVDGVVHGGISSTYQKNHIEKICSKLNLKVLAPLWHENPIKLLKETLDLEFETVFVGLSAYGFNSSWLGRKIDEKTIEELVELQKKYHISPVGEGGEYETLVLNAPFFKKKIQLIETEVIWKEYSGFLLVKEAKLV
jgi:ABC transporter with metal-binding/Fe-S-binding domain ATP-binding protein